ncbi:MAG: transcriptional repressor [bacterium]|nr:transcriptional repressor [bacterium]
MLPQLQETLSQAGYSMTKPRKTVFGALQAPKPKTMRQLVESLESVIDRASVYRTISLFERLGIVNRIQQGWKYRLELSDAFMPHHHHLTCQQCQRVVSFDEPEQFDVMINAVATKQGFVPHAHNLEITGLCSSCQRLSN